MKTRPSENIDCQAPSMGSLQSETRIRNGGASRDISLTNVAISVGQSITLPLAMMAVFTPYHLTTLSERFGFFFFFP